MRHKKLTIGLLVGGLATTVGVSSVVLTSCSANNTNTTSQPDVAGYYDQQFTYADPDHTIINGISPLANNITEFVIPNNVVAFEPSVFQYKTNITSLDMSESQITSIPANAFDGCYNLWNLELPKNLIEIGESALDGLWNIQWMNWPAGISTENMKEATKNISVYIPISYSNNVLLKTDVSDYANQRVVLVPNNIVQISDTSGSAASPFYNIRTIQGIAFQDDSQLTTLGKYALSEIYSLKKIVLPARLTTCNDYNFYNLYNLKYLESENNWENLNQIGTNNFTYLWTLNQLDLSNAKFSETKSNSFYHFKNLKSLILPDSVIKISTSSSFDYLFDLEYIHMPKKLNFVASGLTDGVVLNSSYTQRKIVIAVGSGTFYYVEQLTGIERKEACFLWVSNGFNQFGKDDSYGIDSDYLPNIKGVSFENPNNNGTGVKILGSPAFANACDDYYVELPNSLTTMQDKSFQTSSTAIIKIPKSVTTIEALAFSNVNILEKVIFEPGITNISNFSSKMFRMCLALNSYTQIENCPDGLFLEKTLDGNNWTPFEGGYINPNYPQFYFTNQNYTSVCGLTPLGMQSENLVFPSSVKFIRQGLLQNNTIVKSINLSACNLLTSIPVNFANGCSNLNHIAGNSSITTLGSNSFAGTQLTLEIVKKAGFSTSIQDSNWTAAGIQN